MTIAIISHPECELHDMGEGHPEQPARVKVIQEALEKFTFDSAVNFYIAPAVTKDQLQAVHDKDYVEWIYTLAPKEDLIGIDADTYMNPFTLNVALYAAGAVIFAVDLIMQGNAQVAFCNVRPPGHHAESNKAMGFCFFNNVAVGVKYAMQHYGVKRVAIIDFDVHHGNGTQEIFQQEKNVLYCSSFEHPFYPGYNKALDNEHILSVPLAYGTNGKVFREKVAAAWFDKINAFKPELIFFSAGFDGHQDDPLANLNLTEADYVWLTQEITKLAERHSGGKLISVLEGGYNLMALAQCVPAHINAMILK